MTSEITLFHIQAVAQSRANLALGHTNETNRKITMCFTDAMAKPEDVSNASDPQPGAPEATQSQSSSNAEGNVETEVIAVGGTDAQRSAARSGPATPFVPPPPLAFRKRRGASAVRPELQLLARRTDSEVACIQSLRRNVCEQIYATDLCPVGSTKAEKNLWAAALIESIFLE